MSTVPGSNQWEQGLQPEPTTSSSESNEPSPQPSSQSKILADNGPGATADDLDYCSQLVKRLDSDRYLSALFAPKEMRGPLFGLYAFNVELGLIRENITDPSFGEMRLQWWRDVVTDIFKSNVPDNPVARALSDAVMVGRITKPGLHNMIDARTFDLYDDPMPTMNDLEGYLGETSSALILMASLILTHGEESKCAEAAGYAGIAYGLCGLMQSLPITISRGQSYLPLAELERRELSPDELRAGDLSDGFLLVIRKLCSHASNRLQDARDRQVTVSTEAVPAFLPACLVDIYVKQIVGSGAQLIHKPAEVSQLRRQWQLLRFALREDF